MEQDNRLGRLNPDGGVAEWPEFDVNGSAYSIPASRIVFSGVGKSADEMRMALNAGILCFNVESEAELIVLNQVAKDMGKIAPVSLRVNPDVDAKTHPYISTGLKENKFGVPASEAERIYQSAHLFPHIRFTGLDCHIGSQLTELEPFLQASSKMLKLLEAMQPQGLQIKHLDLGGGLGIRYTNETPPSIKDYVSALCAGTQQIKQRLLIEPGRSLVGNSGILLTRVEYLKHTPARNFAIVDAAMNVHTGADIDCRSTSTRLAELRGFTT